ncbi:hypothetical protein ACQY1Q_06210 [Tenacibaculum sp. TC6]|uniref:hypothetical protein n=1 Tax=Tenacibaculum sp. TC6 TaxID=3423223 RepID=UPI003D365CAD
MGKLKFLQLILLTVLALTSCQKNEEIELDAENLLKGNWSEAVYENETITFNRVSELPNNAYGVSFKNNHLFTQKTSGWCGTPPLGFYNEEGIYKNDNSLIHVTINGGFYNFDWRIISLTKEKLVVKVELTEQESDHRKLMDLYNEISDIASSVSCNNTNDWLYVAYGSKACGGPQGYIAYSNKIDVTSFLEKIELYTKAEDDYNKKWSIVSTCDTPQKPTGVTCSNGIAVLKY